MCLYANLFTSCTSILFLTTFLCFRELYAPLLKSAQVGCFPLGHMLSSMATPHTVLTCITALGLTYSELLSLQEVHVLTPLYLGAVTDLVAGVVGGAAYL